MHPRAGPHQRLGQLRGARDDVLAAIEHDQGVALGQVADKGRQFVEPILQAHGGRDRRAHEFRRRDRGQVDEVDVALEATRNRVCRCDGDSRLSDPARADDADESSLAEGGRERPDLDVSPHDRRACHGKAPCVGSMGWTRAVVGLTPHDIRREGVALAGGVDDIAPTIHAIAQRFAHGDHVEAQGAFVDDRVGPDPRHQLGLVDGLSGGIDERDQQIQRAATQAHRRSVALQEALRRGQRERAERGAPLGGLT